MNSQLMAQICIDERVIEVTFFMFLSPEAFKRAEGGVGNGETLQHSIFKTSCVQNFTISGDQSESEKFLSRTGLLTVLIKGKSNC